MGRPQAGEAYNVADDDPSSREVVLEHVRTHFRAGEGSGGDTLTLPIAPPADRCAYLSKCHKIDLIAVVTGLPAGRKLETAFQLNSCH